MQKLSIVQKYKLQRSKRNESASVLQDKEKNIKSYNYFCDDENPTRTCIVFFRSVILSTDEYRHTQEIIVPEYCPEFVKDQGCEKTLCPKYNSYLEYCDAKRKYDADNNKLAEYPWWVKYVAPFCRSK